MSPRFTLRIFILLLILAVTIPVFAAAAPATDKGRTALTVPPITTTLAPVTTIACTAPCQCLVYADAVSQWGSGFSQCAEHPCEVSRSVTGAPVEKYCYKPKQAAVPVTTTIAQIRVPRSLVTTVTQEVHAPLGQVCGAGLNKCDATCVNIQTDPLNCGSCGYQCSPGEPCTGGSCGTGCPAGLSECRSGECLDLQNDNDHCGDCATGCGEKQYCSQGNCIDSPLMIAKNDKYLVDTVLETDSFDYNLGGGSSQFPLTRNWADYTTLTIGKDKKDAYHAGNFRFNSSTTDVRMFLWQVSRYPFPDDPHHWQPRYLPGLVAHGPVEPLWSTSGSNFDNNNLYPLEPGMTYTTIDGEGFQYFRINFTRVASRNPADPPYYDGIEHVNTAGPQGRVTVADVSRLPFNAGGVTTQTVNISFLSLVVPTGYTAILPFEFTESEMGNPTRA